MLINPEKVFLSEPLSHGVCNLNCITVSPFVDNFTGSTERRVPVLGNLVGMEQPASCNPRKAALRLFSLREWDKQNVVGCQRNEMWVPVVLTVTSARTQIQCSSANPAQGGEEAVGLADSSGLPSSSCVLVGE